jgi:hypothetical protein
MSVVLRTVAAIPGIRTRDDNRRHHMDIATAPQPHFHIGRPVARARGALRVLDVRDDLSRVTRADGQIVGYVDRVEVAGGPAYRARRYIATERRFVELPTVWNADDAVDSLRWS